MIYLLIYHLEEANVEQPVSRQEAQRIFIVEDDAVIAAAVRDGLVRWGYEAACAKDFRDVMADFREYQPALVLMDISLPYYNGYYWCAEIRKLSDVPVVFLSSHSENMDIVMAMNMGGDDYITKPFAMEVLTAKLNAVLRRSGAQRAIAPEEHILKDTVLDQSDGCLHRGEDKLELTRNEQRILQLLLENKGGIVSRDKIMQRLWDSDSFIDDNTLTVNMNRLRKKLDGFGLEDCIATRRGEGYIIDD